MLDSPMLVDQNMVCRSNTDQRDHFPGIHLAVSLFSGIHQICIPTFLFDPPTQSDIYIYIYIYIYTHTHIRAYMYKLYHTTSKISMLLHDTESKPRRHVNNNDIL